MKKIPSFEGTFAPLPNHLSECDLKYLHSQGALSIPSRNLQGEILKVYREFVHPSMPVLDWEEFLANVNNETETNTPGERKRVSLLLFQAVMFAGVGYVPNKILLKEGFANREDALKILFRRTSVSIHPASNPI